MDDPGFANFYRMKSMSAIGNFNPYTSQKIKAFGHGAKGTLSGDPQALKGTAALLAAYLLKRNTVDEGLKAITGHDVGLGMGGPLGLVEAAGDMGTGQFTQGLGKGLGEMIHPNQPINMFMTGMGMVKPQYGEKTMLNPNDDLDRVEALRQGDLGEAGHITAVQARELLEGLGKSGLFGFQPSFNTLTGKYEPIEGLLRAMGIVKSIPMTEEEKYQMNRKNKGLAPSADRQEILPDRSR
jgi:hypothetical protein